MKNRVLLQLLTVVLAIALVMTINAQSNKSASLVLPPKNWDASKHILAELVITKKPGDYPLQPAWVGFDKVTARAGSYTNRSEVVMQTNRWFRFDKLTVCPGPIFPVVREDRYISNSTNQFGGGFDYRATLPTDNELLAMRDIAAVTNFFGFNPFLKMTNGVGQTVYAGYYTLAPYDSIETLDVCFNNKRSSQNIDSILIRRGHFHQ